MATIYIDHPDPIFRRVVQTAFPHYRGRRFRLEVVEPDRVMTLNSYWSDGYRDYFTFVRLADMKIAQVEQNGTMFDGKDYHSRVPPGFALVRHSYMGTSESMTVIITTDTANPAMLPAPPIELTEDEQRVLEIIGMYTSEYRREYAVGAGITPARYEAAKSTLIEKRLLNRAGAITAAGRNVRGR